MSSKERGGFTGPELELNLAGGLLATLNYKDLEALIRRAQEAGFPNFCVLPFRGLQNGGAERLAKNGVSVVHIENAWNPLSGRIYDHLLPALIAGAYGTFSRRILGKEQEIPLIEDSLFPSKEACSRIFGELMVAFPQAKFISHQASLGKIPSGRFLLEIHPGLRMSKEEIVAWAQEAGVGLVFDPSHLLEEIISVSNPGQPTHPKPNYWEEEFNFFGKTGRIEVVDIHPRGNDYGSLGELRDLAEMARETGSIRYLRVEVRLPTGDQWPFISRKKDFPALKKIAETLQ